MDRRAFLALLGLAGCSTVQRAQTGGTQLIRPPALRQGDTVGLVTPSTLVTDPDVLATAVRTLEYFGLKAKMGQAVGRRFAGFQDSVRARVDELHSMFSDRGVQGVFAVRGGYGSMHLLDDIDYAVIRNNPKVFLGYSDITALHLAIHKRAGLVTFHGPVSVSGFTEYTQRHFRRALFERAPLGELRNPPESNPLRPSHIVRTIRPGHASGPLIGGNLSLIAATMGTPYEIDTTGAIYFFEDVSEQPYSLDRLLMNQKLAGKLQAAAGIIVGECNDCGPREFRPSYASPYSMGETFDNILGDLRAPVFYGLTVGHTANQLTLPLGLRASMDAVKGTLTIEESALQ
jgi:muramoyltetrapeptide carboxypeptidase